jgi:hypothetical protein
VKEEKPHHRHLSAHRERRHNKVEPPMAVPVCVCVGGEVDVKKDLIDLCLWM